MHVHICTHRPPGVATHAYANTRQMPALPTSFSWSSGARVSWGLQIHELSLWNNQRNSWSSTLEPLKSETQKGMARIPPPTLPTCSHNRLLTERCHWNVEGSDSPHVHQRHSQPEVMGFNDIIWHFLLDISGRRSLLVFLHISEWIRNDFKADFCWVRWFSH